MKGCPRHLKTYGSRKEKGLWTGEKEAKERPSHLKSLPGGFVPEISLV
jgi:hypothetical protein